MNGCNPNHCSIVKEMGETLVRIAVEKKALLKKSVKEIIIKYLEDNKFDGLCGDGCGCVNSDDPLLSTLMICDSNACDCVPGYKKMCDTCEDKPECEIREDDDQEYCIRSYK